jgi:hypothetical protein
MFSDAEEHVLYQIGNAPIREYPYPHFYVDGIFPDDFYTAMRRHWPSAASLRNLDALGRVPKGAYAERFVMPFNQKEVAKLGEEAREFWMAFGEWLLSQRFIESVMRRFDPYIHQRFGPLLAQHAFSSESLIVRDHTNYKIGPHTDAPHRLLSMLFYCPDDDRLSHLGTSIYRPKDPWFTCKGGPHYDHSLFHRVATMRYRPNTLFAFFKTDDSFHGVEPIADAAVLRDLLLYDIRVGKADTPAVAPTSPPGSVAMGMLRRLFGK